MAQDEVLQGVTGALSEVLGVDEDRVTPEATLVGDLEASSLDIVDLLFQFRRKFGVNLTLAEVQRELGEGPADGDGDGAGEGYNDALFEKVTVKDVAGWISSRLPQP